MRLRNALVLAARATGGCGDDHGDIEILVAP